MTFRNTLIEHYPALEDPDHANWGQIPGYMRGGLIRYLLDGIPPGDFLTAVINNDLMRALGKADGSNAGLLKEYGIFFHNYIPNSSFGHARALDEWCAVLAKHAADEAGVEQEAAA